MLGMTHGRDEERFALDARRTFLRQSAQRLAGTDFEEEMIGVAEKLADAIGEAHGVPQMADPILRIGRLSGRDPRAGDVGDIRDARRRQGDAAQALEELGDDRLDDCRMTCRHERKASRFDLARGQRLLHHIDLVGGAGDQAGVRRVDRGEGKRRAADQLPHFRFRQRNAQHRAFGQTVDETSAESDHRKRVFERHHTGQTGGDVLAEAVTDHRLRPDAPRLEQGGHCVLRRENRRQRRGGLLQRLRGGRRITGWIQEIAQVESDAVAQDLRTFVDAGPESRLAVVKVAAHVRVLRPSAGKHEHDVARSCGSAGDDVFRIALHERAQSVIAVAADHHPAPSEVTPSRLERVRHVGQRRGRIRAQEIDEAVGRCFQRTITARRKRHQVPVPAALFRRARRCFFEHDVRVRSADAERADAGAARTFAPPFLQPRVHVERAVGEVDGRIRLGEVEAGRELLVLQRKDGLDQAGHARGGIGVTEVRLHGADGAEALCVGAGAERFRQAGNFDRIT